MLLHVGSSSSKQQRRIQIQIPPGALGALQRLVPELLANLDHGEEEVQKECYDEDEDEQAQEEEEQEQEGGYEGEHEQQQLDQGLDEELGLDQASWHSSTELRAFVRLASVVGSFATTSSDGSGGKDGGDDGGGADEQQQQQQLCIGCFGMWAIANASASANARAGTRQSSPLASSEGDDEQLPASYVEGMRDRLAKAERETTRWKRQYQTLEQQQQQQQQQPDTQQQQTAALSEAARVELQTTVSEQAEQLRKFEAQLERKKEQLEKMQALLLGERAEKRQMQRERAASGELSQHSGGGEAPREDDEWLEEWLEEEAEHSPKMSPEEERRQRQQGGARGRVGGGSWC
eukprot:g1928.t1